MSTSVSIDRIHQILINDTGRLPTNIPHQLTANINSVHDQFKSPLYTLWSGESLESFIESNLGREVFNAYISLKPYSYRSDLARFCLLFVFGGLYVDLGVRILRHWEIPSTKGIAAFRDISFISESWTTLQTGLLWSRPGRQELQFAIENIVKNVSNRYYGSNPLYPTGPVTLGRAFIRAMVGKGQTENADDQYVGQCRALTSDADLINLCYVTKQGTFVAMRSKDRDGDLTHLGLTGVNDYNAIWRNRSVYGEKVRKWTSKDPLVRRHRSVQSNGEALVIKSQTTDIALFGPYVNLSAGVYEVELTLAAYGGSASATVEITSDCGQSIHRKEEILANSTRFFQSRINVVLWHDVAALEVRVFNYSLSAIAIKEYSITEQASWLWPSHSSSIQYRDMACGDGSAAIRGDMTDSLIYGPYENLPAGYYKIYAVFSAGTQLNDPYIEVLSEAAQIKHEDRRWDGHISMSQEGLNTVFRLESDAREVEFRLGWSAGSTGEFLGYALYELK